VEEAVEAPASDDDDAYADLSASAPVDNERSTRRERRPDVPPHIPPDIAQELPAQASPALEASGARTRLAPPSPETLDSEAQFGAPTRLARLGRTVRRTTLGAFVTLIVLGAAGYFGRSYLPARVVGPVTTWIRALPARLDAERARLWSR